MGSRASRAAVGRLPPVLDLAMFRRMADLSNEGLYLLDRTGRFLYVNAKGHAQMGGYTMAELLALRVSDICPDVPPVQFAAYVAQLEHTPLPPVVAWTRRKDGSMILLEVSMARVALGTDVHLFGVASDITERRAAEAARKELAARLLETIERERQRVARELHDDVGQALATVGVLLDALDVGPSALPAEARPTLVGTRATITRIGESLARIVREYHPAELVGLGLADALRGHVRQLAARHGVRLHLTATSAEGLLTPEQELHVYRVAQEALANAIRHAGAATIHVTMALDGEALLVEVRDDGAGFDPGQRPAHGIGLATMRERAMLLHGALTIDSGRCRGTTVRLSVPLVAEEAPPAAETPPAAPVPAVVAAQSPGAVPLPAALDLEVFRRMADMASEAFRLADAEGRFIYVNERSGTLSGYTRAEMLQMTIFDLNPTIKPETWHTWKGAVGDRLGPFETCNRRRDGTLMPVEVSIARIESGATSYFFAVVRDITDRKEAEAAQHGFNRRLLHTLEAERHRVARELDDEVGQAVATVGVLLHALENAPDVVPADLRPSLAAAHTTVRQITESIARIARDYRPTDLLSLGIEDAIRTHVHDFAQRHGLSLRLATSDVEGLLPDEHALHLYRIVQEALSNVARHARAHHVSVRLGRRGSQIVATIRDDGIGFDDGRPAPGGLGLVTMRERAALIAGRLELHSRPGRGTTVQLTVPVNRPPAA